MSARRKHAPVTRADGLGYTLREWEEDAARVTQDLRWALRDAGVALDAGAEPDLEAVAASAERALQRIGSIRHAARVLLSDDG